MSTESTNRMLIEKNIELETLSCLSSANLISGKMLMTKEAKIEREIGFFLTNRASLFVVHQHASSKGGTFGPT